jgi:hypothetical protein
MLDKHFVENNFYRELQRNYATTYPTKLMAPELLKGARIHVSGAGN